MLQLDPPDSPTLTSTTPHQPNTSSRSNSSTNRGRAAGTRASGGRASSGSKLGLHAVGGSPQQVEAEQQAVYDALLRAVLDGVRNLDLEYHQAQNGDVADAAAQKLNSPDNRVALRQVSTNQDGDVCQ